MADSSALFGSPLKAASSSATRSSVPAAGAMLAAVLAGAATAVAGTLADDRALYYVAIAAAVATGSIVAVTRTEPLRFVFLALIVCFPIAAALVPPGRFGITVFDLVMIALTIGMVGRKLFASSVPGEPIFPTKSLLIAWLLSVPCVVFSQFPGWSLLIFAMNFSVYVFFLYALAELRREQGLERLVSLLSIVVLIMAGGLFVDHFLHVNLSMRGDNLNQVSYLAGTEIWRAGGFFQDPQKGGAFLACTITFFLLLSIRGRFRGMPLRFLVWAAITAGLAALVTTISRSAILACVSVSALALFVFNRWSPVAKLAVAAGAIAIAAVMMLIPAETWLSIVPTAVSERFQSMHADLESRISIWFDTWEMFADHPMTGIGLGAFRPYLIETRPTVLDYYGIGSGAGVAYVPDQPESGYLKILYEGGLAGSLAALLIAGDALRRAILLIAGSDASEDARTESIAALAGLAAFAVTFVTLFTVSDGRIAGILAFLLAVIWRRSLQRTGTARKA